MNRRISQSKLSKKDRHKHDTAVTGYLNSLPKRYRIPLYIISILIILASLSWLIDQLLPQVKKPEYGVSFSIKYAEELGNDWQDNYRALLSDLDLKQLRLMSYWDTIEPSQDSYDFMQLDWQFEQAAIHNAKILLVVGVRQPRWPECFEPEWVKQYPMESIEWRNQLFDYIKTVVERYKKHPALKSYQVENEPVNNWFGGCRGSRASKERLTEEFNLVKSLDTEHPVYMSLSDQHGLPLGQPVPDKYGYSVYRIVYSNDLPLKFYITYPTTDWYHRLRAFLIKLLKDREVYIHELQLEPWGPVKTSELSLKEQDRSMSQEQMYKSITYARKIGVPEMYLWGGEWWYWRKTSHNDPTIWETVKNILRQ